MEVDIGEVVQRYMVEFLNKFKLGDYDPNNEEDEER